MKKFNIIFAGTPDFAVPALHALIERHHVCAVFTQPDKPAGRGYRVIASPVKEIAQQAHIPVHQPSSLKDPAIQKIIADYHADMMIVAAYGLMLPEAVLKLPRLGCLNIHASWLPRWRGAAPIQRAILAGDTETGISIMRMAKGLDTGDVICLHGCAIKETDTTKSLQQRLAALGAEAIVDALTQFSTDNVIYTPQQENLVTYATKITKQEARIDWQQEALQLDRMVRAYNPWPVAFTEIDGKILRIWQTTALPAYADAAPGTIVGADKNGIDVATGSGVLRLQKIQWSGKNTIAAADAVNAQQHLFCVGNYFS